ncbi:cytochrome c oxidase subunit 3 [soil metagenome]
MATNAPVATTEGRHPIVAHHFNNILQQQATVRFGMWGFLVTEVMFFGGVFCAYTVYRLWFPYEFEAGSSALNPLIAGINSFLLLGSSFTCTLAIRAAYAGKQKLLKTWLLATILLGCSFLGLKAFEYYTDIQEGLVPSSKMYAAIEVGPDGKEYEVQHSVFSQKIGHILHEKEYYKKDDGANLKKVNLDRTRLFFMFYWTMTGLHVIHMVVGIGLFIWQYILASMGFFKPQERYVYIEVLALYWHFVELVWIFLLPLLYMTGHFTAADLKF